MLATQSLLTAGEGIERSSDDRLRGRIIEQLLCHAKAEVPSEFLAQIDANLAPFIEQGLAQIEGGKLSILPDGLPYARVIAAMFDDFRKISTRQFSSAI